MVVSGMADVDAPSRSAHNSPKPVLNLFPVLLCSPLLSLFCQSFSMISLSIFVSAVLSLGLTMTTRNEAFFFIHPVEVYGFNLNPIKISGSEFVDSSSNSRWIMKGSGYDYDVSDENIANWQPALEGLIAQISDLNALRLYVVDPTQTYDQFMEWADSKGLYIVVPLTGATGCSVLNRDGTPGLTDPNTCYPSCLLDYGEQVVNRFSVYPNTLAYVIANEVMIDEAHWAAAPCVKAYTRDIKNYQYSCTNYGMRYVPVIYTAADNPITGQSAEQNDRLKLDYLTCGDDESARIDAFGMNLFRWCSDACTYQSCGDQAVVNSLAGNGAPLLLTEYGCDQFRLSSNPSQLAQRDWKETLALYSTDFLSYFSGGSAYTYGIRGGETFAFYDGGSSDPLGAPGLTKVCGFPNNECNVDNYAKNLASVQGNSIPPVVNVDVNSRNYTCPTVLSFDLTVPPTRQGANGYSIVYCPVGTGSSGSSESGSAGSVSTTASESGSGSSEASGTSTSTTSTSSSGTSTSTSTSSSESGTASSSSSSSTNGSTLGGAGSNSASGTHSSNSTNTNIPSNNNNNKNAAAVLNASPILALASVVVATFASWLL